MNNDLKNFLEERYNRLYNGETLDSKKRRHPSHKLCPRFSGEGGGRIQKENRYAKWF